jgi:hypothetical protein
MTKFSAPLFMCALYAMVLISPPLIAQTTYTELQISVSVAPPKAIDTLYMGLGQDTTLFALGKRSDNGVWESVPVTWSSSPGLHLSPPSGTSSWRVQPSDTASGRIIATMGSSLSDTVVYTPPTIDAPLRIVLYPFAGPPGPANSPYPNPPTAVVCSVGHTISITAKVFDRGSFWLSGYERSPLDTFFHWKIIPLQTGIPPACTLSANRGFQTTVIARGYLSFKVVCTYMNGSSNGPSDTLLVGIILLGHQHHLVIEPDPNWQASPNRDNPIDTLLLPSAQTIRSVYAIVRDTFGNFVEYSTSTDWKSEDTSIAVVYNGLTSLGEGIVTPRGFGQTRIIARRRDSLGWADTVTVRSLWSTASRARTASALQMLRLVLPGSGERPIRLPVDERIRPTDRVSLSLQSLSGQTVFKAEVPDVSRTVAVSAEVRSGMYLVWVLKNGTVAGKERVVIVK